MSWIKTVGVVLCAMILLSGLAMADDTPGAIGRVEMKISGPGAINDSTIKVGEPLTFDFYFSNDTIRRGFSCGFRWLSDDIKTIIHVADSGNGLNDYGDVKGLNGWENKSVFDFTGILVSADDWDSNLPDTVGLVGIVLKKRWHPQALQKQIVMEMIVPEPGTLVVDSCFFPPGGEWMYDNEQSPGWGGPYRFQVVE
jgi:hypothetical protein